MVQPFYNYEFGDICETGMTVRMESHKGVVDSSKVSIDERWLYLGSRIAMSPEIADLVDLATAVQHADRLSVRSKDRPYRIQITLPVRCPKHLGRPDLVKMLEDILYHSTRDHWQFDFRQRRRPGRRAELQRRWELSESRSGSAEVCLMSGGLDATAGLVQRIAAEPDKHFVLLGTGSNTFIHKTQRCVVEQVQGKWPGRTQLIQVPIRNRIWDQPVNRQCRTRGFAFSLIGAACAYMQGQDSLYIYENGIGALNLPYRKSEVGIDHSQATHPIMLLEESHFLSAYLGMPFALTNPFLYHTKAQLCEALIHAKATDLICHTVSCDRRLRQAKQPTQCGCCSSCLLRRQALAALAIDDPTDYMIIEARLLGKAIRFKDGHFMRAMVHQTEKLGKVLVTTNPWQGLCIEYGDFAEIVDKIAGDNQVVAARMQKQFIDLYRSYVSEWQMAEPQLRLGLFDEEIISVATKRSYLSRRRSWYGINHSRNHRYARVGAETTRSPKT